MYTTNWSVIPQNLPLFLQGALLTLEISLLALLLSIPIGAIAGLCRVSRNRVVSFLAACYVEFFRGVPLLVLLIWIFFVLGRVLQLGSYWSAIAGLAIFSGAFVAEIVRAGIQAVPRGQMEAARAVGFTRAQTLRYVVAPQLVARTLPALTGQVASIIKDSSLLSVIAVIELTQTMREITATNYNFFGGFLLLGALYLVLTLPIMAVSRHFEKRLDYAH